MALLLILLLWSSTPCSSLASVAPKSSSVPGRNFASSTSRNPKTQFAVSSVPDTVNLTNTPTALNNDIPSKTENEEEQLQRQLLLEKHQQKKQKKSQQPLDKLQSKLLKQLRQVAKDYKMMQDQDHIMVCVSGGKDSATLLQLLLLLQTQLKSAGVNFDITAVHVDQKQPGYNGTPLINWFQNLGTNYKTIEEDTYSIVVDKTKPNQSYCTMCSRLRRGILYSTALELGCNKIALGHHADDALETLLLNMLHAGQLKAMPARYTSRRGQLAVMRPLITCLEDDIREYAELSQFPILPCNLCSNQANLQRPQVKLLLSTLEASFNPNAKQNLLHALTDVRPSHLLDQSLRQAIGMDSITGEEEDDDIEEV